MIRSTKGLSGSYPTPLSTQYNKVTARSLGSIASPSAYQFDQVNISRETSVADSFQRQMVSRLVREVRTAYTAGDIGRIKEEVQSGHYQVDPAEIAGKLLLEDSARGID